MTIISDTAKKVINKNKEWNNLRKKLKKHEKAGESMDEYFLGKDPRKTAYYKNVMKELK